MSIRRITLLLMCFIAALGGRAGAQELVANGDFESGLTDWTIWSAPASGFWNDNWIHSNDCDIWVPTNGCPYEGTESHAQKKGSGSLNAHGGIYQVIDVNPGYTYRVTGRWSGGATGNVDSNNGTWWEVVAYDGVVSDSTIDAGLRPEDALIDKKEANNLQTNEIFQFQWEAFEGTFTAQSEDVTLAFKTGSYSTFEAAAYHDVVSVTSVTPLVSILPAQLDFGQVRTGTDSQIETATIENSGAGDLTVNQIGPVDAPFDLTGGTCGNPPFMLVPGTSCTLEFQFSPTGTGTLSTTVEIESDSPESPDNLELQGFGTQPAISLSPDSLDFGDQLVGTSSNPGSVTVENTGDAELNVSGISSPSGPFSAAGGTCGATPFALQPGNSCTIDYTFTPSADGQAMTSISVESDAPGSPYSLDLQGNGTQALLQLDTTALTFSVEAGQTGNGTVNVTNTGTAQLTITELSGLGGRFALDGGTCFPSPTDIAVGESCSINVVFNADSMPGTFEDQLDIVSNSPSSPDAVSVRGTVSEARPIPTMSNSALALMALMMVCLAMCSMRSRA